MNFRNWMVFKQSTEFADPLESNDDLRELADAIKKDRQFPRDADSLQEVESYLKKYGKNLFVEKALTQAFAEYDKAYPLVSINKVEFLKNKDLGLLKEDVNKFLIDKSKRLISASFSYNPVSQRYIVMITYSEKQRQKVDDNC